MKENKVAFLIHSLSHGGAERITSYLTQYYDAENKYLIVYNRCDQEYPFGGEIIDLDIGESSNIIGKLINYLKRIYKLRKIKKKLNIDKTISMLDSANIVNILSRTNDKIIISLRNHKSTEFRGLKQRVYNKVIKYLYNKADKIVAISEGVKLDAIEKIGLDKNKIEVIYNPIDVKAINRLKIEGIESTYEQIFRQGFTIITSGRLTYQKGQWHLIKAIKKVVEKYPNVKLVILGKGELETNLKKLTSDLELNNHVIFLGYQSNPFKYLYRSDLFVLTSLFEGFGNVILESMACHLPIISTDCNSGPKEILSSSYCLKKNIEKIHWEEFGVLIPPYELKDIDWSINISPMEIELSKVIIQFIENSEMREKYMIKSKARLDYFTMNEIVDKWKKI